MLQGAVRFGILAKNVSVPWRYPELTLNCPAWVEHVKPWRAGEQSRPNRRRPWHVTTE
jgi:hypothetical protein